MIAFIREWGFLICVAAVVVYLGRAAWSGKW